MSVRTDEMELHVLVFELGRHLCGVRLGIRITLWAFHSLLIPHAIAHKSDVM